MTEVANSFVVGHWAAATKMMDRHVSKHTRNVVSVEREEADKQPKEVYEHLLSTFSKEGDLILDIGSGNGKKKIVFVVWQPQYTTGNCVLNAHSLIWHQTQGKSDKNFHEIVLFKETEYWSRVFHMETYNTKSSFITWHLPF